MRRYFLLALLLLATGCAKRNLALDNALASARDARARGDLIGEALALRDACAAAPGNKEVCQRAAASHAAALDDSLRAAETACALVDASAPALDGCLSALVPVRRLEPGNATATELADAAGRAHGARCGRAASSPSEAIRRIRCAESRQEAIGTPTYSAWVDSTRRDAATGLAALAGTPGFAEHGGARAVVLGVAQCLAPSDELEQRRARELAGFASTTTPGLAVSSRGAALGELCEAVAGPLGGRVSCTDLTGADPIRLDATVALGQVAHTTSESTRTEHYLAGIDRHDNPAYPVAVDDEREARDQYDDAEVHAQRSQQRCDEAQTTYAALMCTDCVELTERDRRCEQARNRTAARDERRVDWERARDTLDATPAVLEQEVWRDARFTVRSHGWSLAWEAAVVGPDGERVTVSGSTATGDDEHGGSPAASIGADPLTEPNAGWYLPTVRDQLANQLSVITGAELGRRVTEERDSCPGDQPEWSAGWLDCWATAQLWSGADLSGRGLLSAETVADDFRATTQLPSLACR